MIQAKDFDVRTSTKAAKLNTHASLCSDKVVAGLFGGNRLLTHRIILPMGLIKHYDTYQKSATQANPSKATLVAVNVTAVEVGADVGVAVFLIPSSLALEVVLEVGAVEGSVEFTLRSSFALIVVRTPLEH